MTDPTVIFFVIFIVFVVAVISSVALFIPDGLASAGHIGHIVRNKRGGGDGCFLIFLWQSYVEFLQKFLVALQNQVEPLSIFFIKMIRLNIWYVTDLIHDIWSIIFHHLKYFPNIFVVFTLIFSLRDFSYIGEAGNVSINYTSKY